MPRSRLVSFLGWSALALLALAGLAAAGVYAGSAWILRRRHDVPLRPFAAPDAATPADTLEGRRVAILVGCLEGCHGREGEGGDEGAAGIFWATAPALASVVPLYGDAELVRLIRYGVKRDGRSALGMPSATFYPIGDADLRRVIGYLRRRPAVPPQPRTRDVFPLGRLALVLGKWHTSADGVDGSRPRWGELPRETPAERGRYLASIICAECHGLDLQGDAYMRSPALHAALRGYDLDQFRQLMRTGTPVGGRDLGLMGRVASRAFVHFTDDEVADLYAYLRAQPPAGR